MRLRQTLAEIENKTLATSFAKALDFWGDAEKCGYIAGQAKDGRLAGLKATVVEM